MDEWLKHWTVDFAIEVPGSLAPGIFLWDVGSLAIFIVRLIAERISIGLS